MSTQKPKTKVESKALTAAKSEVIIFDELKRQLSLPFDEQKKLIASQSPLTDNAIRMVIDAARLIGVPLQGINLIPIKQGVNVYINSDGIDWLLHHDPRKLKCVEVEILNAPKIEGDTAIVKGIVEFQDGSRFTNIGAVVVDEKWNCANALMKAATKATRRAGGKATGKVLPVYEDYIEYREEQMKDITPAMEMANGNSKFIETPATLMQFTRNLELAKIKIADACDALGVEMLGEIKDFGAAWAKLKPSDEPTVKSEV